MTHLVHRLVDPGVGETTSRTRTREVCSSPTSSRQVPRDVFGLVDHLRSFIGRPFEYHQAAECQLALEGYSNVAWQWESSSRCYPLAPDQPRVLAGRNGEYTLIGQISAGGMGVIYLMEGGQGPCIVKMARPLPSTPKEPDSHSTKQSIEDSKERLGEMNASIRSLIGEIIKMLYLSDPSTRLDQSLGPIVYDFGFYQGQPWVAMEKLETTLSFLKYALCRKIEEVDLAKLSKLGREKLHAIRRLSEKDRVRYILKVFIAALSKLAPIHQASVLHRDLNPSNIMLSSGDQLISPEIDPCVKIIDFGISLYNYNPPDNAGTPKYLAPERIERTLTGSSKFVVGIPSDIFAIGVSLFWSLSGGLHPILPTGSWDCDSFLLNQRMTGYNDTEIPNISNFLGKEFASLDAPLKRALARDPDSRFQRAMDMANSLKAALDQIC